MLPNLDELRHRLAIPDINTGRQIHLFGHRAGPVTDDIEGLHALLDEHRRIRLMSGVEFSMQMYRGQTRKYSSCTPTLARLKKTEDQLLALCRRIAFEDAIGEHPMVRMAEQARLLDSPLYVDREGLAQHYGLATDMLDVTSNFDVASFFATCIWDESQRTYLPVPSNEKAGVMYRITPALMIGMEPLSNAFGPVHIVGWQPLPRPEQQRASVVKMQPEQDFTSLPTVETFYFRHQEHISHRVWEAFDQGDVLFPKDAAAELATQAETLTGFTHDQIERAWERLSQWTLETYDAEKRKNVESTADICILKRPGLNWDGLGVETSEEKNREAFDEVLSRVRFRLAAYGS